MELIHLISSIGLPGGVIGGGPNHKMLTIKYDGQHINYTPIADVLRVVIEVLYRQTIPILLVAPQLSRVNIGLPFSIRCKALSGYKV